MRCLAHIVNLIVLDGLKLKNNLQAVERVRAAVKFVKNSPARLQRFKDLVSVLKIESKSLLSLDVPTRWNSTYEMLEIALKFKSIFGMFGLHKEIDLGDGEISNIGPPEDSDWDLVRKLIVFLESFFILTNNVSASLSVTANSAFDGDTLLCQIQQVAYELFDEYTGLYTPASVPLFEPDSQSEPKICDIKSMKSSILDKVKKFQSSTGSKGKYMSIRPEFERYLNEEGGEDDVEILKCWKLNSPRFSILARMAHDILAMPVSTVASEAAFSTGGRTLDQFRSSLTPKVKTVQGLICGQDWLRTKLKNDRDKVVNVEESLKEL
ncbi:zinc finger BED domain-containing protein RICESLEEPER 3-like [Apium graveolens]|uniref:zinc finger BED domain-containing protein RICESLEEPER 3-like n=1 Tax=Apium graveolens TaxID=4045 RepID=UPI003D79AF3B